MFSVTNKIVHASAGDGIIEVNVPPRGTFLHAMDGFPYDGAGDRVHDETLDLNVITSSYYNVEGPAIVDLHAEGFTEGDKIIITYTAGVYYSGTYNPTNPDASGWPLKDENNLFWGGLLGVFSTTSTLKDIKETDRVPGAVDAGTSDFLTPPTKWTDHLQDISDKLRANGIVWYSESEATDIPNDFKISKPHRGFEMIIPSNARFLFLCCIDDLYYDNLGEIKVTIEKDTDLDGIPDHWEINGIDVDEDGTVDIDLPALGADWEHKDIFVEIDFMPHNRPNQFALDSVIDAFDNSPVTNPDMVSGINLHIIVDESIPYKEVLSGFDEFYTLKSSYLGTQNERLDQKTVEAKKKVFRYCLSVDKIWLDPPTYGCPGISEGLACDDFILATGTSSLSSVENQAAVFMHELGHSLGLAHGGGDQLNYKPNYLSIMNYRFQYAGLLSSRPLDYSRRELPPIDETNINEAVGIGEATKTVWYATWETPRKYYVSSGDYAIDWNNDRNITSGLHLDLNNDYNIIGSVPSSRDELLAGYNDWAHLVYRFRGTPLYRRSATPDDYHIELTIEEIEQITEDAKNIIEVPVPESQIPINEKVSVGVKQGDWIEYSASHTGNYPNDLSKRFSMKVEEIDGKKITVSAEGQNLDGKDWSISETYDLETGFHDLLLIPSGLDVGDQFYHEEFGNIDIQGAENYEYAGEERTVVWATFLGNTLHWDQDSGVLCQADWNWSSDYEARWILDKTSLWGQNGLDVTLIAILGMAAAILIILFLFIRRKKKDEKNKKIKG